MLCITKNLAISGLFPIVPLFADIVSPGEYLIKTVEDIPIVPTLVLLIITILTEFLVIFLMIRKRPYMLLGYCALVNLCTVPFANYTYHWLASFWFYSSKSDTILWMPFLGIEFAVVVIEAFMWKALLNKDSSGPISYKNAFLLSGLANAITASMSFIPWSKFF